MAEITYRANTSAKAFPFVSDNWGRTVIVPQYDGAYNRAISSDSDTDQDVGVPQIFYCHNVMPSAQGFGSVGYATVLSALSTATPFSKIFLLRSAGDTKAYLGITSGGEFYINTGTGWTLKGTYPAGAQVTVAYVSGVSYIYIDTYGCIRYNFSTGVFVAVTLTGLSTTNVAGIASSTGYLIAWSKPIVGTSKTFTATLDSPILTGADTSGIALYQTVTGPNIPDGCYVIDIVTGVSITINNPATGSGAGTYVFAELPASLAWSSTLDPTDFTPSLATGAGGGAVEAAKGAITFCADHALGFIVYTATNAIAALYSNNFRYPFNFKEIVSAGGVASPDLLAIEADSGNHYAYTSSGFQAISTARAQTILPEMTDFIAGGVFEDYNETTDEFVQTYLTASMKKAVNVVADRYFIISYGISSLTHAIVFDMAQKRFGKLKVPHVDIIEYELPAALVGEIPRRSIGVFQTDGTLKVVDFTPQATNSSGVIALGKYQFIRSRLLQLVEIQVENVSIPSTFRCIVFYALDGKNTAKYTPPILEQSGKLVVYGGRINALNHSLVFKGSFQLNSLVLSFSLGGGR
jgi:hypothetical protein